MTVPYYISEDESDMRGIKHGWYPIEDDGDLSSGRRQEVQPKPPFKDKCHERNHYWRHYSQDSETYE
jgi:hypothetical protein